MARQQEGVTRSQTRKIEREGEKASLPGLTVMMRLPNSPCVNHTLQTMIKKHYLAVIAVLVAVLLAACSGRFLVLVKPGSSLCHWSERLSLSSEVDDCCCDYDTVNSLNRHALRPVLQSLVRLPFFRYFEAKLWCDCPFWPDDGMCRLRDCSVCECPEGEFPEALKGDNGRGGGRWRSLDDFMCQEGKPQALLDRTLDPKAFCGWAMSRDSLWTLDDEREDGDATYLNLLLNPERYTGYSGASARRIWDAIYWDNVLVPHDEPTPPENRVLYKLISGLHSSISVHIAADYLLDESTNQWGPNATLLHERVLKHPDRVHNLYFTFLFVLRAVNKASDYLLHAEYNTGNPSEDEQTSKLIHKLVHNERLQVACQKPFDDAKIWQGADATPLLLQLQKQFCNISALMDCVGCEKCKLWGKLQMLGLGTALEIVLSDDISDLPLLHRNEVTALINLLSRLSESLTVLQEYTPTYLLSQSILYQTMTKLLLPCAKIAFRGRSHFH